MEFIPRDSALFRNAVDAVKEFLPTAQVHISAEGIKIRGMDVSHVGFVDYFLAAADCEVLRLAGGTVTLGVNMAILARVLSPVGAGDRVIFSASKKLEKLMVSYTSEKLAKKSMYEVPLLNIDQEALDLPELAYAANIKTKTADVNALVREVAPFGDAITLRLDEDGFQISTEGDCGKVRLLMEATDDREMTMEGDSIEASFGMKYVSNILKAGAALSPHIELDFDAGQPMRASFKFGGHGSFFVCYLAPKVTDS